MEKPCPRCGQMNQRTTQRCDCGYDFDPPKLEQAWDSELDYQSEEDERAERRAETFLKIIQIGCGLPLLLYPMVFIASLLSLIA